MPSHSQPLIIEEYVLENYLNLKDTTKAITVKFVT